MKQKIEGMPQPLSTLGPPWNVQFFKHAWLGSQNNRPLAETLEPSLNLHELRDEPMLLEEKTGK